MKLIKNLNHEEEEFGDACCKMDEVVNVSVPSTPKTKNVLKQSGEEDLPVNVTSKATDEKGDETDEKMTSYYIGICNFSKAENNVEKRTDFKLYHGMMRNALIDDLDPELELTLVYKTANGSYRHYPIRTGSVADSKYYYVDCGEKRPFHHSSLNHLVKYHQINAQRHPEQHEYADLFPWWEMSY
ncbi:hypothetical protein DICVIV_12697 [Dictyocaulus viviparus]|uniref:SH2 domain protein n=1 Tax=Dictyocaulus viviparus TaxID=29172 RepID=A0A0D8X9T4_DICVI|nr:hypothetical protein DICVIV_12697 [Dictyocaulus viviparus]